MPTAPPPPNPLSSPESLVVRAVGHHSRRAAAALWRVGVPIRAAASPTGKAPRQADGRGLADQIAVGRGWGMPPRSRRRRWGNPIQPRRPAHQAPFRGRGGTEAVAAAAATAAAGPAGSHACHVGTPQRRHAHRAGASSAVSHWTKQVSPPQGAAHPPPVEERAATAAATVTADTAATATTHLLLGGRRRPAAVDLGHQVRLEVLLGPKRHHTNGTPVWPAALVDELHVPLKVLLLAQLFSTLVARKRPGQDAHAPTAAAATTTNATTNANAAAAHHAAGNAQG